MSARLKARGAARAGARPARTTARPPAIAVGDSELARWFYGGRYGELVAEAYDGEAGHAEHDVAFVVGALTFVDRVDEARALFTAWQRRPGPRDRRTAVAGRFFLGLAAARAGYFDRSFAHLVTEAFRDRRDPDPWVRAFVFQGLACQCYFTGRYPGAARLGLRALQAAHEAGFLYGAMLGTDLRGHSLCQMGQLQRGIAMLEQAKKQASRLGLTNNAFAVDASVAIYSARFVPHGEALHQLEALLGRRAHDSYSRRALLTEAAVQYALRGRHGDAARAIDDADRDALRGDTRRGKVLSALARLWVTRWHEGPAACAALVAQAQAMIEPRDIAYRAELLGFEAQVARATGERAREDRATEELRQLARTTQHALARAALGQLDRAGPATAFDEDAVTPVLRAVARRDASALSRIVSLGLLGVIPELLGLTPARRIILVPAEDLVVLEDHGDVVVRQRPPRWCPALLRILASGDARKERIVLGLWGLRAYHPELHDPPVRTTIHRLRTFLQPYGAWIEVGDDGYRTTVPVLHIGAAAPAESGPLWEEGLVPTLDRPRRAAPAPAADEPPGASDAILERLSEVAAASVPELARALELSASTVLRALRVLVAGRKVERVGFARATRYRLRAARAR